MADEDRTATKAEYEIAEELITLEEKPVSATACGEKARRALLAARKLDGKMVIPAQRDQRRRIRVAFCFWLLWATDEVTFVIDGFF